MATTSALASSTSAATTALPNKYSELSSDQFVKIMLSELSNQDPLKPQDSSTLIQQMANIRSIQSDVDLSKKLDSLVTQNQLATAGNLLGQKVTGLDSTSTRISGVVVSISRTSEGPVLNLRGGTRLRFADIERIEEAPVATTTPPTTTPPVTPPAVTPPVTPPATTPATPTITNTTTPRANPDAIAPVVSGVGPALLVAD